jgi:hypothetical protein
MFCRNIIITQIQPESGTQGNQLDHHPTPVQLLRYFRTTYEADDLKKNGRQPNKKRNGREPKK